MNAIAPLSPVASFAAIIELVCKAVACCGGARPIGISGLPVERLPGPLLTLIWNRLHRIIARFTRAATTPPAPPRRRACAKRPARPHKPDLLPRHYAWLRRLVQETGGGASQLEFFLNQPDITGLIAADARLGRILRPLCHMLGIRRANVPILYPQPPPQPPHSPSAKLPEVPSAIADGMAAEGAPILSTQAAPPEPPPGAPLAKLPKVPSAIADGMAAEGAPVAALAETPPPPETPPANFCIA